MNESLQSARTPRMDTNFRLFAFVLFFRIEAAKAQIVTAGIGMVGACFALWIDAIDPDNATSLWVTKLQFWHFSPAQLALGSFLPPN